MIDLSYVISATGQMGIFTNHIYENHHDSLKNLMMKLMGDLNSSISKAKFTRPRVSTLYNAYTEEGFVERLSSLDNLGAEHRYADSGGLQIVTAGKQITDEIKQRIYKTQAAADFAMCFDVIPLESLSTSRTRNERSNVGNKVFNQANHTDAGLLTGKNIKAQIEMFKELGAKTKVIAIIQGNNNSDMVHYYEQIASQLKEEDYDYIGGIAMADTCIGNGTLESIEMLRGAKEISKVCHSAMKKHLHILGVGSISRMRPILYLNKSGYLDTFERVSYDSSSHTSTFDYGLLKVNGGCKAIGSTRTPQAEAHFRNVYRLFENSLWNLCTEDEMVDIILGDGTQDWKYSTVKERAIVLPDEKMLVGFLCKVMHTYFQINNFVLCLDDVMQEKNDGSEIGRLLDVHSDSDMDSWFRHISRHVRSKRIKRKENMGVLPL